MFKMFKVLIVVKLGVIGKVFWVCLCEMYLGFYSDWFWN